MIDSRMRLVRLGACTNPLTATGVEQTCLRPWTITLHTIVTHAGSHAHWQTNASAQCASQLSGRTHTHRAYIVCAVQWDYLLITTLSSSPQMSDTNLCPLHGLLCWLVFRIIGD